MKRITLLGASLIMIFLSSRGFGLDNSAVVGNYELQGVMEVAGMLMLKADQKYAAGFSYGAADWIEEGTWKLEGDEVLLQGGRFKEKNYKDLSLVLPSGTRMKVQDGKLTVNEPDHKLVFVNPNKTPAAPEKGTAQCLPLKDPSLKLTEGSLLSVEKNQVVINDVLMHQDVTVRRSWADKNIPTLLNPPQLYKTVQKEIPKADVICIKPVVSGEGRMRVRGRVVKLDHETLVVEMGECLNFEVSGLSDAVLKTAKTKQGQAIDVEIPYSAIMSSGTCF
jgi:hypothetical protein